MNHNGILTSQEELEAHGYRDYETIQEVGEFILRLDFRGWGRARYNANCLICYFTEEST